MRAVTEYRLSVKEWPESERPREKLAHHGAAALSTAELLAIILRVGTVREDVVTLSRRLLVQKGGIVGLAEASMTELVAEHGLGLAKGRSSRPRWSWANGCVLCSTIRRQRACRCAHRTTWPIC